MNYKSREQSFLDYYKIVQKEYIVAELRAKIYTDVGGIRKSKEIMKAKYEKIVDMSIKNSQKVIFEGVSLGAKSLFSEKLKDKLYVEIYGEWGLPNFIYRDDKHRTHLEEKDIRCYFSKGAKFKMKCGDKSGYIQHVDLLKETCSINNKEYFFENISRIFE